MTIRLKQLLELSRLDSQLAVLEEDRNALPGRRAAATQQRGAAESRLATAREALQQAEAVQRRSEALAQDQEALLKKLQGQQFQVKTNDAYTALLHEMERAQAAISDAETHILEAMDGIEQARARQHEVEVELRGASAHLETEQRACDDREKELSERITALRSERDVIGGQLDAKLLVRYQRIALRRRPAVTTVSAGTCQGCRVGIPPQTIIEIQRGEEPISCPNCNRILALEEQQRG